MRGFAFDVTKTYSSYRGPFLTTTKQVHVYYVHLPVHCKTEADWGYLFLGNSLKTCLLDLKEINRIK